MAFYLEKLVFNNRAPFDNLELSLSKNSISVLTAVNGKGKTTILSHIADAFYEMARNTFPQSFADKETKLYRISSTLECFNFSKPSIVYLRFDSDGEKLDYLDIRNKITDTEYNDLIKIEDKIPHSSFISELEKSNYVKKISNNFSKEKIKDLYSKNVITYFPAYRFEQPGYLNDVYKNNLSYRMNQTYSGYLINPIEGISSLQAIANWIMDLALDLQIKPQGNSITFSNVNKILNCTLESKFDFPLRLGIGQRNNGGIRIQIVKQSDTSQIYPSIFNFSSGESSLFCMFTEILRQSDNIKENIALDEINGIVIIDEIDKHLHIKLQKVILPVLINLFKNIQFIISTHSPFLELGLSEDSEERTNIYDLDNNGLKTKITSTKIYNELYEMMISDNNNFKKQLDSIKEKINISNTLQIVSEGKNIEHIRKAIQIIDNRLIDKVNLISGAEDKSGSQQLKNAFEVMKNGTYKSKFLFIWDCDAFSLIEKVQETNDFKKYCFENNIKNTIAKKGIENLYQQSLFSEDVYETQVYNKDYGNTITEKAFNKQKFLEKIIGINDSDNFINYFPLIEKIRQLI